MSKRSFQIILILIFGLLFLFGDTFFLCAQESEEFTLEEITVTAEKRTENQQKVPIAMEVISGEKIKELGRNSIDEILSTVSNATIEKALDGYRVTIRGITDSSEAFHGQSSAPPAVAINTDGVYSNRKDTGMGLFDIERVEILYGPQSTMYSTSSPGGVVNVITARPKLDKFEASGSLEVGDYELLHLEAATNAPLGEKTALRAAVSTSKRGSYMTNGQDNENMKSARLRTLFQANDNLSFTLTGEISQDKGSGFSGVLGFGRQDDEYYPLTRPGAELVKLTDPWTAQEGELKPVNDTKATKISAEMAWDTGIGSLTLIPSYTTRDGESVELFPEQPQPGSDEEPGLLTFYRDVDANEKSVELRMTSDPDFFFKWIAGFNYYRAEDYHRRDTEEYLTTGWGEFSDRQMTQKNRALYGNITYPLTDSFRATAGYRQTWDTMTQVDEGIQGIPPGRPDAVPGALEYTAPHTSESSTAGRPDWKVGLEYDLGTNSMLYADYSSSFRVNGVMGGPPPGGGGQQQDRTGGAVEVNENASEKTTEDPEELNAYTLGIKNRFLDDKLQLNVAAYYYDYKNYRARHNEVSVWYWDDGDLEMERDESTNEPYANGTGDGSMLGLDLSADFLVTRNDRVDLSVSYIHSEWTNLKMTYYYTYTLQVNAEGTDTEWVYRPGADYSGEPMMCTPPWTVNLSYDHSFHLWNGGALKATLSTKYRTSYNLTWAASDYPVNYQETYHMEDFNLVYNSPEGKWYLSTYVKNITNYAEKRQYQPGPAHALMIGDPRTYGAVLSVKF